MTGMDDLVTWFRAQLDEDEAEAREALSRQTVERRMIRGEMVDVPNQPMPEWRRSVWPPSRVLAEVDAKRRILDTHAAGPCDHPDFGTGGGFDCTEGCPGEYPCDTVRLLALPLADRPGYLPEWAP